MGGGGHLKLYVFLYRSVNPRYKPNEIFTLGQAIKVQSGTRNTDSKMKVLVQCEAEKLAADELDKLQQYPDSDERQK